MIRQEQTVSRWACNCGDRGPWYPPSDFRMIAAGWAVHLRNCEVAVVQEAGE